jgi:hypothetical protein
MHIRQFRQGFKRATIARSLAVFGVFGLLGFLALSISNASTFVTKAEAESGSLAGNATAGATTGASGGASVKFSTAATPSPTPPPSQSCPNPSHTIPLNTSDPQDGISIGDFYITNDTWNAANYQVSQTMYICDYTNWYVTATMNDNANDGAVKTYPNVHQDFNNPKISSFKTISSSFAETGPHVGIYEYAYDMWLNGVASNGSTEVMIWNDNNKQTPGGSKQASVSFDGRTYDVYKGGSDYVAFVDMANTTSGTINILSFYNYIISKNWIPATSTIGQIDYGVELVSTNNVSAKFEVNNFSLTAN